MFLIVNRKVDFIVEQKNPYEILHNDCIRSIVYNNIDTIEQHYSAEIVKSIVDSKDTLLIKEHIIVLHSIYDKLRSEITKKIDKEKHLEYVKYASDIKKKLLLTYHFDIDKTLSLDSTALDTNPYIKEIIAELQALVDLTHMY